MERHHSDEKAMTAVDKILVVIDPTAETQPALERIARLPRPLTAQIMLLICDSSPNLEAGYALAPEAVAAARARSRRAHRCAPRLSAARRHHQKSDRMGREARRQGHPPPLGAATLDFLQHGLEPHSAMPNAVATRKAAFDRARAVHRRRRRSAA